MSDNDNWRVVDSKKPCKERKAQITQDTGRQQGRVLYPSNRDDQNDRRGNKNSNFSYKPNRRIFPSIPDFESPEEAEKFTALKNEVPHLMMPGRIRRIKAKINIDKLDTMVLSDDWVDIQRKGWVYDHVLDPEKTQAPPGEEGIDYLAVPLHNGWGDMVIFIPSDS